MKNLIRGAVAGAVLLVGVWLLTRGATHPSPVSPAPATATTSTPAASTTPSRVPVAFEVNVKDALSSWHFTGAYSGNPALMAQARADREHLTSLIGTGEFDDYDLYLGLGNDATLMGDGETAFRDYNRAVAIHPKKGLAYANIAHLMEQLGAYVTAADAYAKATAVEPGMLQYHIDRLSFLTEHFASDTARVEAAFKDVEAQFGDTSQTLSIKATWLTAHGLYEEAINAWERAKQLLPGRDTSSIDVEIVRLRAKI